MVSNSSDQRSPDGTDGADDLDETNVASTGGGGGGGKKKGNKKK
jgi:hypothetical protein